MERRALFIAAAAFTLLGVLRMAGLLNGDKEGSAVYLFGLALAALALPSISKLSVGKDGVTFEKLSELSAKVAEVKASTTELSDAMQVGVGGRAERATPALRAAPADAHAEEGAVDSDDPNAGKFGGQPSRAGRELTATVTPSSLRADWFRVELVVRGVQGAKPLAGTVRFHLHPTFREAVVTRPAIAGQARLDLLAWGAFTVGAVVVGAQGEATKLELDLATLGGAPADFRAR